MNDAPMDLNDRIRNAVDRDRLVRWASQAINVPSFTGAEEPMAELMAATFADMGLQTQWQQVEEG
ncbi:MAG: hypothetical protein ACR2OD_05635, partial [Gaiellaceae bacterium]